VLLVRPEAARLTAPGEGLLQGLVDACVFLGSDLRAQVRLPSGKAFNVRCPRQLAVRPGDAVGIAWDPRRAALLPAEVRP
jgi:putative spermidine/putrescine transport system ATP-binding protein